MFAFHNHMLLSLMSWSCYTIFPMTHVLAQDVETDIENGKHAVKFIVIVNTFLSEWTYLYQCPTVYPAPSFFMGWAKKATQLPFLQRLQKILPSCKGMQECPEFYSAIPHLQGESEVGRENQSEICWISFSHQKSSIVQKYGKNVDADDVKDEQKSVNSIL